VSFLINAAGYTGKPNVDACELNKTECLVGNAILPGRIADACATAGVPWGHVSSGCIYSGAKIDGKIHRDLTLPNVRNQIENAPETISGFLETDTPNFSFRSGPCSFYSGTKAQSEEVISGIGQSYIWRLRIPFDQFQSPRNYLTKLQAFSRVYDNANSLSHRRDFVSACLDLWQGKANFGTYNVTNPGFVTTRQVVEMIRDVKKTKRNFSFYENDEDFYAAGAKAPRSNCILDTSKLTAAGISLRPVRDALEQSWKQSICL
jgi:hypothetical protein